MEEVANRAVVADTVKRFMMVLLDRRRVAIYADIVEVFARNVDERLNRIAADVTTAIPMTAGQEDALCSALGRYSGKTVRINATVVPEILGGVVARVGGTVIDGSLRSRLDRIRNALIAEEI